MSSSVFTVNGRPPEGGAKAVSLLGFSVADVVDRVRYIESGRLVVSLHTEGVDAPCLRVSRPYATYPATLIKYGTLLRTREEALRYNEDPNDWLFELISGLVRQADSSFFQRDGVPRTPEPTSTIHCE